MEDETDTTLEGVTDNVDTSEDDNSDDIEFFDLPDEEDTEEADEPTETDDEEEADDPDEAVEADAEEEAEPEDTDPKFAIDGGGEVALSELKKGYLRQSDYTRKAQELSNERNSVTERVARMEGVTSAFVDFLTEAVPDMPDEALAYTDTNAYVQQEAQHKKAMAKVKELIKLGETAKEEAKAISQEDRQKALLEADTKLQALFPEIATEDGRKAFYGGVAQAAREFGFSNEELSANTDPRIFALAHWAKKGKEAAAAVAKVKTKAAKAPPATPRKPAKASGAVSRKKSDAFSNLEKTGSIEDAVRFLTS